MRRILVTASLFAFSAGMTLAQGIDWTGGYGGVSMATHSGTHEYDDSGEDDYDLEGPAFGAFGGYMWGNGNLVYGVEGAISLGGVYEVTTDDTTTYKDEYEYTRFIDVKGRVGYAVSNFLLYGALGMSQARFESDIGSSDQANTNTSGMVFGLGADYQIADRYFVGAEYLRRDYDFFDSGQSVDIDAEIDTFTLRAGMKF
jgi:outer membrane immunogenic protein